MSKQKEPEWYKYNAEPIDVRKDGRREVHVVVGSPARKELWSNSKVVIMRKAQELLGRPKVDKVKVYEHLPTGRTRRVAVLRAPKTKTQRRRARAVRLGRGSCR